MKIHMIGICGTGMGSLAGLLAGAGHQVSGSDDHALPPMATMLRAEGIPILEGYHAERLTDPATRPDLVVVGNIVGRSNPEVQAMLAEGIEYLSMPEALGRFFLASRNSVVVAGTHGKTTTTGLIAQLLLAGGLEPSFLVGGVLTGLERSHNLGGEGGPFIVEGDEYETSFFDKNPKFLHYNPRTAVLTSIEYDHAEMYPSLDAIKEAFARLVALLPPTSRGGGLIVCADDENALEVSRACRAEVLTYGLSGTAGLRGEVIASGPEGMRFRASQGDDDLGVFRVGVTGDHNLRNCLAAIAVARRLGLTADAARRGLEGFRGVHRRQEICGTVDDVIVIDDFAHHPTAVRETIAAMRSRYASRRLWAVFEPCTNTTRRDVFQDEYARAFDGADEVVIAPVNRPERAPAGHRLEVPRLIDDLRARGVAARNPDSVAAIVALLAGGTRPGDVVLIMSNGTFGGIHQRLLAALAARLTAESSARARPPL